MDRRSFIRVSGLTAAGVLLGARARAAAGASLRTITYNILACTGYPLKSTTRARLRRERDSIPERLAAELKNYAPDIVTFQEAPTAEVVARIADALEMNHVFFPCKWPGNRMYPIGFPGALLTRHEIAESENAPGGPWPEDLFTRHWGRAVVRAAGEDIAVYSVHLHPSDKDVHRSEVDGVLRVIQGDLASGRSLLLQGDFNHKPEHEAYARWTGAGLMDAFATKGVGDGRSVRPTNRQKRIDYVWAHGPIAARLQEARVLYEGAFSPDPEDETSYALSDHLPVMATFG